MIGVFLLGSASWIPGVRHYWQTPHYSRLTVWIVLPLSIYLIRDWLVPAIEALGRMAGAR